MDSCAEAIAVINRVQKTFPKTEQDCDLDAFTLSNYGLLAGQGYTPSTLVGFGTRTVNQAVHFGSPRMVDVAHFSCSQRPPAG